MIKKSIRKLIFSSGLIAILFVAGCGGGGGDGVAPPTAVVAANESSYACDKAIEAAKAPHASTFVAQYDPAPPTDPHSFERWPLLIDEKGEELNVAISQPQVLVPVRGIVIIGHGHSASQATAAPSAMVDGYWDAQLTSRGYIVITVARRGNFGSTGQRHVDLDATGLLAKYQSRQISYADVELAATRFQSASLVAALQKISTDSRFQPYLSTILLIGASGGANTVLQTAADSPVFQVASKKALIRLTGLDSAGDTNPDALPGVSEYSARIAKNTVSSLWVDGQDDPITSPGQLACQFKFFTQAAGFSNSFYIVPGLGHLGFSNLLSVTLSPILNGYMTSRGFAGFQ